MIGNYCEVVKEIMEDKGFRNVEQFSKAVGIYPNAVDRWLKGKYQPNVKSIVRLADYYACSTDYLFGLTSAKIIALGLRISVLPRGMHNW